MKQYDAIIIGFGKGAASYWPPNWPNGIGK